MAADFFPPGHAPREQESESMPKLELQAKELIHPGNELPSLLPLVL